MDMNSDHKKTLNALKRIEGQLRGVRKMVEDRRYCVEILTQLSAVNSGVARVQDQILARHLDTCFKKSFLKDSAKDKEKKINEVIDLLKNFRKRG